MMEWVKDVPRNVKDTSKYFRIAEELRAAPGRWALIATVLATTAAHARKRLIVLGCEATTRASAAGATMRDVYARWPEGR